MSDDNKFTPYDAMGMFEKSGLRLPNADPLAGTRIMSTADLLQGFSFEDWMKSGQDITLRIATQIIYGIKKDSDDILWAHETDGYDPVYSSDKSRVYIGNGHWVEILDKQTGTYITSEDLAETPIEQLLHDQGLLFVSSRSGVSAFETNNFSRLWETRFPAFALASSGECLYVSLRDYAGVGAIDLTTGQFNWTSGEGVRQITSENNVLYGSNKELVRKFDNAGNMVWETTVNREPVALMRADSGRVYLGSIFGELYALDGNDGQEIWRRRLVNPNEDPAFPWQIIPSEEELEVVVTQPFYTKAPIIFRLNSETGRSVEIAPEQTDK